MNSTEKFTFSLMCLGLVIFKAYSQYAECDPGVSCHPLPMCPEILLLAKSSSFEETRKFRSQICGVDNVFLVCCPSSNGEIPPPTNVTRPSPTPTTDPPFILPTRSTGGDILPTDCGMPTTQDRIINGSPTPIGGYPWVAALGYIVHGGTSEILLDCAGSLINNRYVLTAAHCLDPSQIGARRLSVIHLGDWDLSTPRDCQSKDSGSKCYGPHVTAGHEEIILHPTYNKRTIDSDDIALIRLDRTIDFSSVKTAPINPVCLPTTSTHPRAAGTRAVATGWGFTEFNVKSDILLSVILPLANDMRCIDFYRSRYLKDDQLCYGGADGKDTCGGDSGGPLVLPSRHGPPFILIGIVSYGPLPCAKKNTPAVYTSVASYMDWIKQNLRP